MREPENIRAAEAAGTDWMGFILWKYSPRHLEHVPAYMPECPKVGVFVNPTEEEVLGWNELMKLDFLQLHGNESPMLCKRLHELTRLPIIKAIPVGKTEDLLAAKEYRPNDGIAYLLFDTNCRERGGSGRKFEWDLLQAYSGRLPFLLSGGIGPEDAHEVGMLHHSRMAGIDINSRFETVPGIKDIGKVETFINMVRQETKDNEQNKQNLRRA